MKRFSIIVILTIISASCVSPKVYKELEGKYAYVKKENRKLSEENESLLSEKNKTGKTNFAKAFWIGLKSNLSARSTKEYSSLIYELKHTQN